MRLALWCLTFLASLVLPAAALMPPPHAVVRPVANGFSLPLEIVQPGDGSERVFILEQNGLIRVIRNGSVMPTPFLDLTSRVATGGERGLLGLAFDPHFATNQRFFVYYTIVPDGNLRISSFLASASNADLADPSSELEVITIDHSAASNHNGGHLVFGPDGYLYAGTGDGGGAGDPLHNGQNLTTLLGKLLRLDVSASSGYAIPPDNPTYPGVPGARREIWAYGLRNPWRFGFDRATGDLYIGDVGQDAIEEVDYLPAGTPGGTNFGWPVYEGTTCYNAPTCSLPNHTPPILQYSHVPEGGYCITGGFVYRGTKFPELQGYYLYGDYVTTRVWAAARDGSTWRTFVLFEPPDAFSGIAAFGEDAAGEIYVASHGTPGHIDRIARPGPDAPTAVAPFGTIATGVPTYTWNAVPNADTYALLVQNTAGVRVSASFPAGAVGCSSGMGTCAAMPSTALAGGTAYNWFVNASNAEGTSLWSATAPISVSSSVGGGPPAVPVSISPTGGVSSLTPTYAWNAVAGATGYRLLVQNTQGVTVDRAYSPDQAACPSGSGSCMATPPDMLADQASYNWFVNASNAQGTSDWSALRSISVSAGSSGGGGLPPAPTAIAPSGTVATNQPAYSWGALATASSYYLVVQNTLGVAVSRVVMPADAGCASGMGTCSVMPAEALPGNTTFMWFVNASNALGMGPWSTGLAVAFSDPGHAPAAPMLMMPSGTIATTMPTYSWNAAAGATSYYLLVQNTQGVAVSASYDATALGCASGMGTCSITPAVALMPATPYAWFVKASGSGGTSDWSAGLSIRTP